jgi:hypothetical protein
MKNKLILLSLLIITNYCKAENYEKYYQLINKAEEKFVNKKDKSCYIEYDIAFKKYKPFLKDPFVASQIALYFGDTLKFFEYIKICFQNGMPITSLNVSPIINKVDSPLFKSNVIKLFKISYKSKIIDVRINDKICLMCHLSDSLKVAMGKGTQQYFHLNEDETRKYILDSFLVKGQFPNEQLIGITTNELYANFYSKFNRKSPYEDFAPNLSFEEFELRRKCPYNIILHSKCFYTEHKTLFYQAMLNGYIHPKEIAILEETAILWNKNNEQNPTETCGVAKYKICYNVFPKNPMQSNQIVDNSVEGLKIVEMNREKIYLQKYSIDQQKKVLEKELGIKFFFDFADR